MKLIYNSCPSCPQAPTLKHVEVQLGTEFRFMLDKGSRPYFEAFPDLCGLYKGSYNM